MNRCCVFLFLAAGAIGCATPTPWPSYEAALRCHLDGKKNECDAEYKKAIKYGSNTQGLHASYGTHLLLTGRMKEAEKEFARENKNYPQFAAIAIGRLATNGSAGAPDMTPAAQAPAPAAQAPAPAAQAPAPAAQAPAAAPSASEPQPAPVSGSGQGGAK